MSWYASIWRSMSLWLPPHRAIISLKSMNSWLRRCGGIWPFVGRPLPCADQMRGHTDFLDVVLFHVLQNHRFYRGPPVLHPFFQELLVDREPGVSIDADVSMASVGDYDRGCDSSVSENRIPETVVGRSAVNPVSGRAQGEIDSFGVELVAVLLESLLDPRVLGVVIDRIDVQHLMVLGHCSPRLVRPARKPPGYARIPRIGWPSTSVRRKSRPPKR